MSEDLNESLQIAVNKEDISLIIHLLELGVNINSNHLLINAIHNSKSREVLEILVEQGAEVNATNHIGETPLHIAVSNDDKEMVEFLIDKGAEVNTADSSGKTPLKIANEAENTVMIRILTGAGAK